MKVSKWCVLVVIITALVSPFHLYAKWHLKHFEYGIFRFISTMFYLPSDYRDIVWTGIVYPGETYSLSISHNYLGGHEIVVVTDMSKREFEFELTLNCDSGFSSNKHSKRMGTRTGYAVGSRAGSGDGKDLTFYGRYQVADFDAFENCQLSVFSDELTRPVFVYLSTGYLL